MPALKERPTIRRRAAIPRRTQCVRYIANESQDWFTVWRREDDVFDAIDHLDDFPESGSFIRELHRDDIRLVLVGDCRVIYRVKRHNVKIPTIRHTAFLIKSLLSL